MTHTDANWSEVLWLAARNDPGAIQQLDELVAKDAALCSERIREFVLSDDYEDEMGTCDLLNRLARLDGLSVVVEWIANNWATVGSAGKRKICSWAYIADGMPTKLALSLFDNEKSTVRERHLLAAGLASSASQRSVESEVLELLPRIGKYDDPQRQRTLDGFIESARKSFE